MINRNLLILSILLPSINVYERCLCERGHVKTYKKQYFNDYTYTLIISTHKICIRLLNILRNTMTPEDTA